MCIRDSDCCVDVIRQMEEAGHARPHVVFMTAAGTPLTEEKCKQLAQKDSLLLDVYKRQGMISAHRALTRKPSSR